jgi:hypothetical protein
MTDDAVRFAERILELIDSAHMASTYKMATLMALIDVVGESVDRHGAPPTSVSGKQVARRVIELYWPQTAAWAAGDEQPRHLRQAPQRDIAQRLAEYRSSHHLGARASLAEARAADPSGWQRLEDSLVATVLKMPIPKLQNVPIGNRATDDRFIYDFGWRDEEADGRLMTDGFDDRLHLKPDVGSHLVRLAPLVRPAIQMRWANYVARRNPDLVGELQLGGFLFGADRINLDPIRAPLLDLQKGRCFYCGTRIAASAEVDHFVPWSLRPDNLLDNLVAADRRCNGAKSAALASTHHLESWMARSTDGAIAEIARATDWPRNRDRTVGNVRASYLVLRSGAALWVEGRNFEPADADAIRNVLARSA